MNTKKEEKIIHYKKIPIEIWLKIASYMNINTLKSFKISHFFNSISVPELKLRQYRDLMHSLREKKFHKEAYELSSVRDNFLLTTHLDFIKSDNLLIFWTNGLINSKIYGFDLNEKKIKWGRKEPIGLNFIRKACIVNNTLFVAFPDYKNGYYLVQMNPFTGTEEKEQSFCQALAMKENVLVTYQQKENKFQILTSNSCSEEVYDEYHSALEAKQFTLLFSEDYFVLVNKEKASVVIFDRKAGKSHSLNIAKNNIETNKTEIEASFITDQVSLILLLRETKTEEKSRSSTSYVTLIDLETKEIEKEHFLGKGSWRSIVGNENFLFIGKLAGIKKSEIIGMSKHTGKSETLFTADGSFENIVLDLKEGLLTAEFIPSNRKDESCFFFMPSARCSEYVHIQDVGKFYWQEAENTLLKISVIEGQLCLNSFDCTPRPLKEREKEETPSGNCSIL